jgi:CheY-like chemotaxis protein
MKVSEAADARSGLAWLEGGNGVDLVIVELQMPGMDGMAFAREVRTRSGRGDLPVVLLAPLGFRPDNVENLKSLISDYLYKPVRISLLHDVLAQAIDGHKADAKSAGLRKKPESEAATRSSWRVLLVEDNVVNQKVAVQILRRMGYEPDVASNGVEAVEACGRQHYDLVFMDVQMPEMDGLEATRQICARWPAAADRPKIIAMTANVMQGDREKCQQAGMDDYVAKPIRAVEIARAVARVMGTEQEHPDKVPAPTAVP